MNCAAVLKPKSHKKEVQPMRVMDLFRPKCNHNEKNIGYAALKKLISRTTVISVIFLLPQICFPQTRESFEKWFSTFPVASENERKYKEFFSKADLCMGKFRFEESIVNCDSALRYNSTDYLVRAMKCLNYYELGEPLNPKIPAERKKKLEMCAVMARIAQDGIEFWPAKGECYFMRGLANARIATTKGIVSSLFMAKSLENDWLEAVKHHSEYVTPNGENLVASCYIALGSYYRLCPTFFLLKIIFGISGDINRSVDCCRRAFDLDPTRVEIVKEYGISLVTRGLKNNDSAEIENGKKYLRLALALPNRLRTDSIDKVHSKMLLDDIKLCPEYSRDQQQDNSDETIRKKVGMR
jgi:tetratricopeptide (TPR) repeat protein